MKNEAAYRYNRLSANSGSKIELDGQHYSTSSVDGTGAIYWLWSQDIVINVSYA